MRRLFLAAAFLFALYGHALAFSGQATVIIANPQVITLPAADIDDQYNLGGGGGICSEWGHQVPCSLHYADTKTNTSWCVDLGFYLTSVGANTPCINSRGMWVSSAQTNFVIQSRDLTQSAWNVVTLITTAHDQIGIDGTSNSASSITANAGSSTAIITQAITLSVGTRASSVFVKCITCTGTLEFTQDGLAFTTLNSSSCFDPFGTGTNLTAGIWLRCQITPASITNPIIGFRIQNNSDKFAIDVVQLEANIVTQPIITTTVTVGRSVDNIVTAGRLNSILATSVGSAIAQTNQTYGTGNIILAASATTDTYIFQNTSSTTGIRANNTNTTATMGSGTWTSNRIKSCASWDATGDTITGNNGTSGTSVNVLTGAATSYIGSRNAASTLNGPIERIVIWSWKLSATQCKSLTQ